MKKLKRPGEMGAKLLGYLVSISLLLSVFMFQYSQINQREALLNQSFDRLKMFHSLRKASLEDYLDSVSSEIFAASLGSRTRTAVKQFKSAWKAIEGDPTSFLQTHYIIENPYSLKERQRFVKGINNSFYGEVYENFHPFGRELIDRFGYYDLFIIDTDGNILYTVAKESDFATNIRTGPYAGTPLQLVFNQALKRKGKQISISGFRHYAPSNNDPAAFAGNAITDEQGKILEVLAVQLLKESINQLLQFSAGMRKTGETYIVGADRLMRNQSRFIESSTLLETKVDTKAVDDNISGISGSDTILDYRGVRVLSVYSPIDFSDQPWAMIAEYDESEILCRLNIWSPLFIAICSGMFFFGLAIVISNVTHRSGVESVQSLP